MEYTKIIFLIKILSTLKVRDMSSTFLLVIKKTAPRHHRFTEVFLPSRLQKKLAICNKTCRISAYLYEYN